MSAPELETKVSKAPDDIFVLVKASKLSLRDKFMKHKPTTGREIRLKKLLKEAIQKGIKDFYRPCMDPSFNKDGGICYIAGKMPAVDKSYEWWKMVAESFMPERGSRLGTKLEYVAFLGVLIKELVSEGWSVKKAWDAVCNDSKELGHYWNSKNAKYDFEPTGSRKVGRFYDLSNTFKILAEDEKIDGFWLTGGGWCYDSEYAPLFDCVINNYRKSIFANGTGWIVIPA